MMLHVTFEQHTLQDTNLPYHTDNVYFEAGKLPRQGSLRTFSFGVGGPQRGGVTCGGSPYL